MKMIVFLACFFSLSVFAEQAGIIYECTCSYSKSYEPYEKFFGKGVSIKSEQEAAEKSCKEAIELCGDDCRFTGQNCIIR